MRASKGYGSSQTSRRVACFPETFQLGRRCESEQGVLDLTDISPGQRLSRAIPAWEEACESEHGVWELAGISPGRLLTPSSARTMGRVSDSSESSGRVVAHFCALPRVTPPPHTVADLRFRRRTHSCFSKKRLSLSLSLSLSFSLYTCFSKDMRCCEKRFSEAFSLSLSFSLSLYTCFSKVMRCCERILSFFLSFSLTHSLTLSLHLFFKGHEML